VCSSNILVSHGIVLFCAYAAWDSALRGLEFRAQSTPNSLELFQSTATNDLPQVFNDAFVAEADPLAFEPIISVLAYASLNVAQKMTELALTTDVSTILRVASAMGPYSPYGELSWDSNGRNTRTDQVVHQNSASDNQGNQVQSPVYPVRHRMPLTADQTEARGVCICCLLSRVAGRDICSVQYRCRRRVSGTCFP